MSQELTPEQMRVMIAEACGWKIEMHATGRMRKVYDGKAVPDYCNDLNAMAQAAQYAGERLFDADEWSQFGRELEAQHPTASLKDAQGKFYEDTYYQLASLVTGLSALNIATAFCRVLQTRKGE